jgi:hypothetical protein
LPADQVEWLARLLDDAHARLVQAKELLAAGLGRLRITSC